MLKKIVFCSFILSCLSSAYAMEEELSREQFQYFVILQKAHKEDSESIDGLYNALRKLKKISRPDDYEEELNQLYNEALSQGISSEIFSERVKQFIDHAQRRLCPSPVIHFDDNFRRTLWASFTPEEKEKIQRMREAAQG